MGAISNLACIRAHQQLILEAGAAPLLLHLMQPGVGAGCQEAAARGFGNLVRLPLPCALRHAPRGARAKPGAHPCCLPTR